MRFYTPEQIGPKRSYTPEGFLVCHDVPIARTGVQLYTSDEVPIESPSGEVRVVRDEAEVFRPETLASYEGKTFTVLHPDEFVTPDNWAQLAAGTVQNVRRGQNPFDDLMLADIVVTRRDAIDAIVEDGVREVSCGYDAEYEQIEPGKGRQINIIGNHVALVPRGRAGSRCAIQDEAPAMTDKLKFWDRIKTALASKDADAVKEAIQTMDAEEMPAGTAAVLDAVRSMRDELKAFRDEASERLSKLEEGGTEDADGDDKDKETTDEEDPDKDKTESEDMLLTPESAPKADTGRTWTGDALSAVLSKAEILAPGIAIPTTDAATKQVPASAVVKLQRRTLEKALATQDAAPFVNQFLAGRALATLTADALDAVFTGAAELMRSRNNENTIRTQQAAKTNDFGKVTTPASINKANQEYWAKQAI